ncbi:MAG: FHA domain-containing protein [Coleofasciculus sp. S288]|nr:FHA domain-containing protein [Coleofasciculus sp. S288]
MHELTLEWREAGRIKRETILDQQPSKNPGTVRLGRDPARCDIVLIDPTVSGLHVEIFFNAQQHSFILRNLRSTNPPLVDGQVVGQVDVRLNTGSIIYLGQQILHVTAVSLAVMNGGIAQTILLPPQAPVRFNPPQPASASYGLQCPRCNRVSPYNRIDLGCQWCGTSLAAAPSVLMVPNAN